MPGPNKWNSVTLKLVIEIDGVETIIRQTDYTESMNEISEDKFVSSKDVQEMILEDIAICESDFDNSKKQFIWRWLAFILSTRPNHHYVPNNHGEMLLIDDEYMQAGVTADSYIPVEPYLCQPEQMEAFKGCDYNANLFAMMDHLFDVIDTVLQVHFKLSDMMDAKTMRQTAIQKKLNEYI